MNQNVLFHLVSGLTRTYVRGPLRSMPGVFPAQDTCHLVFAQSVGNLMLLLGFATGPLGSLRIRLAARAMWPCIRPPIGWYSTSRGRPAGNVFVKPPPGVFNLRARVGDSGGGGLRSSAGACSCRLRSRTVCWLWAWAQSSFSVYQEVAPILDPPG